jgi:hypothetical protein
LLGTQITGYKEGMLGMNLEETLTAVREYRDRCSDRNSENHTSDGIEIDPHTLAWAEYWLTYASAKTIKEECCGHSFTGATANV